MNVSDVPTGNHGRIPPKVTSQHGLLLNCNSSPPDEDGSRRKELEYTDENATCNRRLETVLVFNAGYFVWMAATKRRLL